MAPVVRKTRPVAQAERMVAHVPRHGRPRAPPIGLFPPLCRSAAYSSMLRAFLLPRRVVGPVRGLDAVRGRELPVMCATGMLDGRAPEPDLLLGRTLIVPPCSTATPPYHRDASIEVNAPAKLLAAVRFQFTRPCICSEVGEPWRCSICIIDGICGKMATLFPEDIKMCCFWLHI